MVIPESIMPVGEHFDLRLRAVFLGRLNPGLRQEGIVDCRPHVHLDVRRHLPVISTLEQLLHAQRHELLVLLPVGHRDLRASRLGALTRGIFNPLIHLAAIR